MLIQIYFISQNAFSKAILLLENLLTMGGYAESVEHLLKSVEMISLKRDGISSCQISDLPEEIFWHSAANSIIGPIVCGGLHMKSTKTKNCHRLNISNGSWDRFHPLNMARSDFSMTEINDLLVSIGDAKSSSSYEHINVLNETKWIEKAMPFSIYNHCSTKLNQSTILITGGNLNRKVRKLIRYYVVKVTFTH